MFGIFDRPHPDRNPLPLTDSPWPVFLILASYIIFVQKIGKIFMKNREPYNLRRVLYVYNLFQIAYNGIYFAVTFYYMVLFPIVNWSCMESFPPDHERKTLERYIHFGFFFNKLVDLLDTVFFTLRKSYKQVTVLHVYHHVMVVTVCYAFMRFYGTGGHAGVTGMINSFVHAIMYFYYFLSALYPGVKTSIWWKKYITIIQLIQFVILFVHSTYVLVFSKGCGLPKSIPLIVGLQAVIMMWMFSNFYIKTYIRPQKQGKKD